MGPPDLPLPAIHDVARVAAPGRPVRVPSSEESGAPGAEPGVVTSLFAGRVGCVREVVGCDELRAAALKQVKGGEYTGTG